MKNRRQTLHRPTALTRRQSEWEHRSTKETICDLGLDTEEMNTAGPNDLIIAVRAKDEETCSRAKEEFAKLVSERNSDGMQKFVQKHCRRKKMQFPTRTLQ
ncbi:MAG: hypothetical protein L6V93_20515 [Clostridiales bacterium]|nr:MAG: hypothetical protein L6V93_20515 [Clostridiales bacterium]